MRCNYRCNMWCNCKKPAKPYPATPSISTPSESEITLSTESHWIYFSYTPTDATLSVTIESNDPNVTQPSDFSYQDGQAQFLINPMPGAQGVAVVTITNNDNPEETYGITVNVEYSEPFYPANNIIVDVEGEGEATVRKTKSKKVRGSGDTYYARVFAEGYESADYVQLSWSYLATPDISYVGKTASDEHCVNMFTTDVVNNIARNIEALHDGGQLGGSCEFEDVAWLNIQNYFDIPYSQESAEQLIAQLSEGEIVEPISSGVTITGFQTDYVEIQNWSVGVLGVYYTPQNGTPSNITVSFEGDSLALVYTGNDGNGYFWAEFQAQSSEAYVEVTFSDGINSFVGAVQCLPYIPVESIGNPTPSEIYIAPDTLKYFGFNYSPIDATQPGENIIFSASNANIGGVMFSDGLANVPVGYFENADDTGYINYYLNSNPENVRTVTVYNVEPSVLVESLSGIPATVSSLAPGSFRSFTVTYGPSDADYVEAQIEMQTDSSVAKAYISDVNTTNHTFRLDYYGVSEGGTTISFLVEGNILTSTEVTIERPAVQTISNLQYTNPTEDGGEVYSRGVHSPVTFEYTPTNGGGGLTITKTGGTKVDGSSWDAPGRADQSVSTEGIDYNNGVATMNFYVDNESSVGQWGSWRVEVENDPNQYLDVKITFANEPQPSTDCTITVAVNDNTMGSVDVPSVTVPVNTSISYNGNQVTIGNTTVTATANSGYQQRGWSNMIFTATEDDTIMAEFEAATPASSYDLFITPAEGTVEEETGEGAGEASFPAPIESGGRISWDGAGVFGVYDSQGNWLTDYVVRNNGADVYAADATVNGDSWPTNDETGDPVDVNVEGDTTIVVSNIIWPTTVISVDSSAVNGTITRTGNWEYVSETGVWQIGGLTSEALLTPSQSEDGVFSLTIEDDGNTWTFDIVPDNFDDYVGWGGDEGFEITGPTNIYTMPGYLDIVNIYPSTITPDPEAQ